MGIDRNTMKFLSSSLKSAGFGMKGLKMCELGNQRFKEHIKGITGRSKSRPKKLSTKKAKTYFVKRGVEHTSIDINGRDGALSIDLSKPISGEMLGSFDVLTNFGTSEHVSNQYECFKNIHNLVREGGIAVHLVPRKGSWKGHGLYSYAPQTFLQIGSYSGYKCLLRHIVRWKNDPRCKLVAVCLLKGGHNFMSREKFDGIDLYTGRWKRL